MGLIDQAKRTIHAEEALPNDTRLGLLAKIRDKSQYDKLQAHFLRVLASGLAERGLLLGPSQSETHCPILISGFDVTTFRRCAPQSQSLFQRFPETSVYVRTGPELEAFHSLFSSRERESLTSLVVLPIEILNSRYYLIIAESTLDIRRAPVAFDSSHPAVKTFIAELPSFPKLLRTLAIQTPLERSGESMQSCVDSALREGKRGYLVSFDFEDLFEDPIALESDPLALSVYQAIAHRIIAQAGPTNVVMRSSSTLVRLALFVDSGTSADLFVRMMLKPLEQLFGTYRIARIRIVMSGSSADSSEIRSFLRNRS